MDLETMGENKLDIMNNEDMVDKVGSIASLELVKIITDLLCNSKIDNISDVVKELSESPDYQRLHNVIIDLRVLSNSLNKGELNTLVYNKGFVLANLKALQSNLRHLTWQTKKISEGDFSQKVDFLGDFSDSFNKMTEKLKENSLRLTNLASLDALTQIPNRRSLADFMENTFATCDKFCIFTLDIDFFKNVNDTYGHDSGDMILVHLTNILVKQFRNTDFVSRYGGEEFVAVLPETSVEIATKVAARILTTVENTPAVTSSGVAVKLTVSIGISSRKPDDTSCQEILKRSDEALYYAKEHGRNQFCVR